ncbi:hypothetical protein SynA1840_01725 [Synechococcus sp. A18-40]|nr:hypothetical protein SynA1840_01725 [Synechococcus sp. A18-40]
MQIDGTNNCNCTMFENEIVANETSGLSSNCNLIKTNIGKF